MQNILKIFLAMTTTNRHDRQQYSLRKSDHIQNCTHVQDKCVVLLYMTIDNKIQLNPWQLHDHIITYELEK